ncbi:MULTISPECIES: DUF3054 domain-containing protein [Thermomonospora]|uniref:Peptidoglycan/LPS O-acetylase OafA/YrhL n=1 Tax=Thermomonospora cellulosilytica TaxID=1411118 RepID=A0A7W3N4Q4_9ACTN|nr:MULTISPECIES: DUF3054 domain-containing protein [Thermomonospora]MBA9007506.1 peptidoglycan/LPS O-acetylase OafA/YrhL [Thermomonospora cellulosilytica]
MRVWVAGLLDVVGVVVFVAIGRASHDESGTLAGIASTAWPFLVGLAAGWAVVRAWRRPQALFPAGAGVWAVTVAGGMALRAVSGQGTALAFVIVATLFLALVLLGWRLVARLVVRPAAA